MEVEEDYPPSIPAEEVAIYLARKKAYAFEYNLKDEVVITADTTVILNEEVLGKASHGMEARKMLEKLSGQSHIVSTGVCIFSTKHETAFSVNTMVSFRRLTDEEIRYYIENFEPYDKAGAYGIQEWIGMIGIQEIKGDYYNVVGLPVRRVYEELVHWPGND
jgi:septum formation protein